MRRTNLVFISLFLTSILNSSPADAKISVESIGLYPIVQTGSKYEIQMGLKAPANIRVTTFLINSSAEKITGKSKLSSGSLRTGKWTLLYDIPEDAREGTYKINIKVIAGRATWIDQKRTVKIQSSGSGVLGNAPAGTATLPYDAASAQHLESLSTYVYGLRKDCDPSRGQCPALDSLSTLVDPNQCKIQDLTFPNDSSLYVSSAFTKPPYSLAGETDITLNWLPVSFKDRAFSEQLYKSAIRTAIEAEGFYEFNSYGRVHFTFEVPSKEGWISLPENVAFYEKLWAEMTTQQVEQYLIDRAGPKGAPMSDAIMFIFPEGKISITNKSFYDRDLQLKLQDGLIPSARVYGIHGEINSIGVNGFTHGVGHALYSFEDLYIFDGYLQSNENRQPASFWDVMGGGGEFFLWQKWHIGWLKDLEVNCVTSSTEPKVVYLEPFQSPSGKKLVVVKIDSSRVILAEYRTNSDKSILKKYNLCQKNGVSQCESKYRVSGLLVYELDTKRKHGAAPFRVSRTTEENLLTIGETLKYSDHSFEVLASDGKGIYVRIKKL
jgi:M6 family metalloprotease-like protein